MDISRDLRRRHRLRHRGLLRDRRTAHPGRPRRAWRCLFLLCGPGLSAAQGRDTRQVPLVVAYSECLAPNRSHGPPDLPGGSDPDASCAPPAQASSQLTVGTPDSNGRGTNFSAPSASGHAGQSGAADDADVLRPRPQRRPSKERPVGLRRRCEGHPSVRITDKDSAAAPNATVQDLPVVVHLSLQHDDPSATVGLTCTATPRATPSRAAA